MLHPSDSETDDHVAKRHEALEAFYEALTEEISRQTASITSSTALTADQVETVEALFANAARALRAVGGALQDADTEIAKKQLRQMEIMNKVKMETARTASSVALANQKVDIENRVDKLVEQRVTAFADDSGGQLAEANRRREELEEQVRALDAKVKSTDETNKTTTKLLNSTMASFETSEKEVRRLTAEHTEWKEELRRVLDECGVLQGEHKTLSENITELIKQFERTKVDRDALAAKLSMVEGERDDLKAEVEAAAAAAASAAEEHQAEMAAQLKAAEERVQEQMAIALEDAIAAEREEGAQALAAKDVELMQMGGRVTALEGEIEESRATATALEEDKSLLQSELASSREAVKTAGAKAAEEAAEAAEKNEALKAQLEATREELASATAQVSATQAELAAEEEKQGSAVENLKRLEAEHQALQDEFTKCRAMLQEALDSLSVMKDEKLTLSEQVSSSPCEPPPCSPPLATLHALLTAFGQVETLIGEIDKERAEFERVQAELTSTLQSLNIVTDEKMTLAEKVQSLISQYEAVAGQISDAKARLTPALEITGAHVDADAKITTLVDSLVERFNALRNAGSGTDSEITHIKSALAEALKSIGLLRSAKEKAEFDTAMVSEQVSKVMNMFKESQGELSLIKISLEDALGTLTNSKMGFESDNRKLSDRVRELGEQKKKLGKDKTRLEDSVGELKDDKRKLSDRVAEMVRKYVEQETELAKTRQEVNAALSSIGLLNSDKKRLGENIIELIQQVKHTKTALEAALSSIGVLHDDKRHLNDQIDDFVHRFKVLHEEHAHTKSVLVSETTALSKALDQNVHANFDKRKLSDQVADLVARHQVAQAELADIKASLAEALKGMKLLTDEKTTLGAQNLSLSARVKDLVARFRDAQSELKCINGSLATAFQSIRVLQCDKRKLTLENVTVISDKISLSGKVNELVKSHVEQTKGMDRIKSMLIDALGGMTALKNDKSRLSSDKSQLNLEIADWIQAFSDMKAELGSTKELLRGAMQSVTSLTSVKTKLSGDKRKQADIINDLVQQYEESQIELKMAIAERQAAVVSEQETKVRAQKLTAELTNERTRVVQAALRTVNEMRAHHGALPDRAFPIPTAGRARSHSLSIIPKMVDRPAIDDLIPPPPVQPPLSPRSFSQHTSPVARRNNTARASALACGIIELAHAEGQWGTPRHHSVPTYRPPIPSPELVTSRRLIASTSTSAAGTRLRPLPPSPRQITTPDDALGHALVFGSCVGDK